MATSRVNPYQRFMFIERLFAEPETRRRILADVSRVATVGAVAMVFLALAAPTVALVCIALVGGAATSGLARLLMLLIDQGSLGMVDGKWMVLIEMFPYVVQFRAFSEQHQAEQFFENIDSRVSHLLLDPMRKEIKFAGWNTFAHDILLDRAYAEERTNGVVDGKWTVLTEFSNRQKNFYAFHAEGLAKQFFDSLSSFKSRALRDPSGSIVAGSGLNPVSNQKLVDCAYEHARTDRMINGMFMVLTDDGSGVSAEKVKFWVFEERSRAEQFFDSHSFHKTRLMFGPEREGLWRCHSLVALFGLLDRIFTV
eukprot:gnl/TRDRNA2_/TRDRNA2_151517_c0_seq2.p1 gnl/TRDRNA2_/TRDRNA2_151517_c0~~gnl/TRDRNA2_/TRDRNA2_151517_c0_seq2.p1  ORF type:complete len:310 (-),score=48.63 gnl/TRDRNA2_/TRDRNA2_151517_c0_seq2:46-975(-)